MGKILNIQFKVKISQRKKIIMEDLDLALSGLEKVHKVVNDAKPKPVIVEPKRLPGPIFKGDSYNRQKRGETYWVKEAKPTKPGIPIGRPGNILGLTNSL